jgi:hypothetical protein
VLNLSGAILGTSTSSNGIASLDVPVSGGGLYVVQVVDLGVGPLSIWSAATPQLKTG